VGSFLGTVNLVEGTVARGGPGELVVETPVAGMLRATADRRAPAEGKVTLAIRPEKVRIVTDGSAGENRMAATVELVIYVGSSSQYVLRAGPLSFTAHAMNAGAHRAPGPGDRVQVELPASSLILLED